MAGARATVKEQWNRQRFPLEAGPGPGERAPLQGVDLRLDQFDLSAPTKVLLESQVGSVVKPLEESAAVAELFWASLEEDSQVHQDRDKQLLLAIFNPMLCD